MRWYEPERCRQRHSRSQHHRNEKRWCAHGAQKCACSKISSQLRKRWCGRWCAEVRTQQNTAPYIPVGLHLCKTPDIRLHVCNNPRHWPPRHAHATSCSCNPQSTATPACKKNQHVPSKIKTCMSTCSLCCTCQSPMTNSHPNPQ